MEQLKDNNLKWRKKAVVYQIYPRSFCDSNGDGIGDINGITSRLDYIKALGADVIWISPIYKSPMYDNGYDISDYCEINLEFGLMQDFDRLLDKAHGMGLKIVMDLVVNHSSDLHPWFLESRSSRDNPKRDYYIWRDGINDGPPNDWIAWFGGSAWTKDEKTNQYYLNCFSSHQPDLNWDNPQLRSSIYDMMRWWLDKGIDGFRLDAISFISKPENFLNGDIKKIIPNGPRVHEYLKEMRLETFSKYDVLTVGETGGVTVDEAANYANVDGSELDMVFHFEQQELDGGESFKWNDRKIFLPELKEVFARWQNKLYGKAWNTLYWCNHDQPRIVSRLGDDGVYREKSAKMLAACLHFMQGTPFIYQGEELGMTNCPFKSIDDYRDLESINAYKNLALKEKRFNKNEMLRYMRLKSRDNSRTPMQWNDKPHAGFSGMPHDSQNNPGKFCNPWIMVNPNYRKINAEEQINRSKHGIDGSVFRFYQELIKFRKTMDIITHGRFELLLPDDKDLFVYTRKWQEEKLLVACNFSRKKKTFTLPQEFSAGVNAEEIKILISNEKILIGQQITLGAFGAVVLV